MTIKQFLEKNQKYESHISLVGDSMIDEYYKVSVNRISPEYPIPIMLTDPNLHGEVVCKPGGAANVARQFKHFNVDTSLFSFSDSLLSDVLNQHEISINNVLSIQEYNGAHVPVKRRYTDGDIQVARWDKESKNYGLDLKVLKSLQEEMQDILLKNSSWYQTAILSDYNKGFFFGDDNWINFFPDSYTIVDPKDIPLSRWKGCEVFKPNYKEAVKLSGGIENWKTQARYFKKELGCQAVIITCGGDGVKGIWNDEYIEFCPNDKVKVMSVVGAGDCFCAGLAMALSHRFVGKELIEVAYEFGAQYVQHDFNRPITPAELIKDKLIQPEDLIKRDYKLVFTNGCFDVLHDGHLQTLRFAKSKGDKLVVALNSDDSIRRLKGDSRPIKNLQQRLNIMAAFECVDFVVSFDENTPQELLKIIKPNVLVKGSQYELNEIIGADIVEEVYRAPMIDGLSTTDLVK